MKKTFKFFTTMSVLFGILTLCFLVFSEYSNINLNTKITIICIGLAITIAFAIATCITLSKIKNKNDEIRIEKIRKQKQHEEKIRELKNLIEEENLKNILNTTKQKQKQTIYICAYCNKKYYNQQNYCSSCGAKLEKQEYYPGEENE